MLPAKLLNELLKFNTAQLNMKVLALGKFGQMCFCFCCPQEPPDHLVDTVVEPAVPADDDEPSKPVGDAQTALLDKLGETLHKNRRRCLSTLSKFAEECDTSVRNVVRCMHALAETLAVNQEALLHNLLRYVS